jgi:recombination DNA repair RAD52 pathway protein
LIENLFGLVYRASFRQTFEEFTAPTGIWKYAVGWTLISLAGLVLAYDGWRRICMDFYQTNKSLFFKFLLF